MKIRLKSKQALIKDKFQCISVNVAKGGMNPPISYYGGKQRMAHNIIPLLPKHTVYVEPFCGGATILFKKPWPAMTNTHHYREVINDHDERLTNFFRVLRGDGEALCAKLQGTLYSRPEYNEAKRFLAGPKSYSNLDWAWAYYVKSQTSFSNVLDGGWRTGTFGRNLAVTWMNKVARLPDYVARMAGVHIECLPALDVIKKWDSPQTLFYCDPPYPGFAQGHYSGYSHDDLKDLIAVLDNAKGSFILSNYKQEYIPKHWEHFTFEAHSSSMPGKDLHKHDIRRVEHIWRVDRSHTARTEIQKLFASGKFDCFKGEIPFQLKKVKVHVI